MERLQEKLGYRFRDRTLLTTALTHPSFGSDHHVAHYQRLEFLGDALLGEGEGASKQLAQQAAAKNALQKLGADHCG